MTRTPEEKAALDEALKKGLSSADTELMRLSLEKGADPDLLITEACAGRGLKSVDPSLLLLALKKGANADQLLFGAIATKSIDVVKLAVEQGGADVNASRVPPGRSDNFTAAHWSYRNFGEDISNYLVGKGMHVDTSDARGNTPLHSAVQDKDLGKTLHYLGHGANPLAANGRGEFPLKTLQGQELPSWSSDYSAFERNRDELMKAMLRNVPDEGGAAPAIDAPAEAFNDVATRNDIAVGHPLELRTKPAGKEAEPPPPNHGKGLHL